VRRGVRRGVRAVLIGTVLSVVMAWLPAVGSSVAGAVSTRVPTAQASGAFVYGKVPVRHEVTRRVVATPSVGVLPLALLYRIASGERPTPTHVLTPDPPATVAPTVASVPAPSAPALPGLGHAWAWGCAAAIAYLTAYAAPEFSISCGNAGGHQATTTCISGASLCSLGASIVIADPCPAAYMNEASNSWLLLGLWHVPLDPYGSCP
jgi:hypothetical protein